MEKSEQVVKENNKIKFWQNRECLGKDLFPGNGKPLEHFGTVERQDLRCISLVSLWLPYQEETDKGQRGNRRLGDQQKVTAIIQVRDNGGLVQDSLGVEEAKGEREGTTFHPNRMSPNSQARQDR